jgi:hypothetical protein
MSAQSAPTNCPTSPNQIWARLATELQERTIRLMAQLAFNLVAAQAGWLAVKDKESNYATQSCQPQSPA